MCHKVNSPHSDEVSNVVLNTCVTKVSSQLGPQKLKFARSSRARFRAKDVTNPCQQGDQPRDGAVYGVQLKCGQLLLEDFPVARCEACQWGHHCMKKCKAILDRNLVVRKNRAICMESP